MATRKKTIQYAFPHLQTAADNTATPFTQITIDIPEAASGTVTFSKVIVDVVADDQTATPANITARNMSLTLQGAGASAINNTNTYTASGENYCHQFTQDYTSYFTANWGSNASRTLDLSVTINTGTSGSANLSAIVTIIFDFDDTQTTHVKTTWIPLNAPTGAMGTSKSTIYDTIPVLDTYLPEDGKVFKQIALAIQGNTESNAATNPTLSYQIDAAGSTLTTTAYQKTSNTDLWYRVTDPISIDTSATHSLYLWASIADFDHPQVWLIVTYTFTPGSTTRLMHTAWLPVEFGGTMGGNTSSYPQKASRELWIQEPGTITTHRIAAFIHYDKLGAISGIQARVGTGSYVAYTDVATVNAGGAGFMIRNDAAYTFARGRNTMEIWIYNTDSVDLGYNLSGCFLVNYSSDVPTNGVWAATHTVIRNLKATGTGAATQLSLLAAIAPDLPETSNFRTSIGLLYSYVSNTTGNPAGMHIGVEPSTSGGFYNVYEALGGSDPETGIRIAWASALDVFRRWVAGSDQDVGPDRLALETARRWRIVLGGSCASFDHLDMYITYHSITFTVAGDVSGSSGGTVTMHLCRAATGERVMTKTRTGDGAFSFTWFDNTEGMYVDFYEDDTHMARSAVGYATGSP